MKDESKFLLPFNSTRDLLKKVEKIREVYNSMFELEKKALEKEGIKYIKANDYALAIDMALLSDRQIKFLKETNHLDNSNFKRIFDEVGVIQQKVV